MKNSLIFISFSSLLLLSISCTKKCDDSYATNYNQKGECTYPTKANVYAIELISFSDTNWIGNEWPENDRYLSVEINKDGNVTEVFRSENFSHNATLPKYFPFEYSFDIQGDYIISISLNDVDFGEMVSHWISLKNYTIHSNIETGLYPYEIHKDEMHLETMTHLTWE